MKKGKFFTKWKTSVFAPLHKEGDKDAIMFYRPRICLCCPSKVLEKIVFDCLYNAIYSLLNDSQFGFRRLRLCIVKMLYFLDKHLQRQGHKLLEETTKIYLDFEKAFDKVQHDGVIMKLELLEISGKALMIIADYVGNRRQKV